MSVELGYIKKIKKGDHPYDKLVQEAVKIIQLLSEQNWTDHNTHDPGITLMESMVYALTEVNYKIGLPIKDLLIPKKGVTIESGFNALFTSSNIFTTNPVTPNDIRMYLMDNIQNISNVWVEHIDYKVKEDGKRDYHLKGFMKGLYSVAIEMDSWNDRADASKEESILEEVRKTFSSMRNMSENLHEIFVLKPQRVQMQLDVNLNEAFDAEEVIAEVYWRINHFLKQQLEFNSLNELLEEGIEVAEIFQGPKLKNGFIKESSLTKRLTFFNKAEIDNIIMSVDGVTNINSSTFYYEDELGAELIEFDDSKLKVKDEHFLLLELPKDSAQIVYRHSEFEISESSYNINLVELTDEYIHLESSYHGNRTSGHTIKNDVLIPEGDYVDIGNHFPIRNHLPSIYGVGSDGLMDFMNNEKIAQTRQLKAYLMPMDQIMTNALETLERLNEIFEPESSTTNSYFSKVMSDMEELNFLVDYPSEIKLEEWEKCLTDIDLKYSSDHMDRENRVLDDILSRFSEKFQDNSILKNLTKNYPYVPLEVLKVQLLTHKRNYISNYAKRGYHRGSGANHHKLSELLNTDATADELLNNSPTAIHQLGVFTGILNYSLRSITEEFEEKLNSYIKSDLNQDSEISINSDSSWNNLLKTSSEDITITQKNTEEYVVRLKQERKKSVLGRADSIEDANAIKNQFLANIFDLNISGEGLFMVEHSELLPPLNKENYGFVIQPELFSSTSDICFEQETKLTFSKRNQLLQLLLSKVTSKEILFSVLQENGKYGIGLGYGDTNSFKLLAKWPAHSYSSEEEVKTLVNELNNSVDHLYTHSCAEIESMVSYTAHYGNEELAEKDLSLHISYVMPGWSTRFSDKNFQSFFMRAIEGIQPAHISYSIKWLSFSDMKEFENLYFHWLTEFNNPSPEKTSANSLELLKFLKTSH